MIYHLKFKTDVSIEEMCLLPIVKNRRLCKSCLYNGSAVNRLGHFSNLGDKGKTSHRPSSDLTLITFEMITS
jgi:hypothetical protein